MTLGDSFLINTTVVGQQGDPDVTILKNGNIVAVWTSALGQYATDTTNGDEAKGQMYTADGAKIGVEFQLNTSVVQHQRTPAVTALDDGGFITVWWSFIDGINGQRYNADGTTNGNEFLISDFVGNFQRIPDVISLEDGGFVVTWENTSQGADVSYGIYGQIYNANGTKQGGEFHANSFTNNEQRLVSTAALTDGGFVVTWRSMFQDTVSGGIYGQVYNADGTERLNEFRLNTTVFGDQTDVSTAGLDNGGFVAVWSSFGQDDAGYGIYGQLFDANGAKVGNEFGLSQGTGTNQGFPSVTVLSDGSFIVTWHTSYQNSSSDDIIARKFNEDGTPDGNEFLLVDPVHSNDKQFVPVIEARDDGGYVVVWTALDSDSFGIYGKIVEGTGSGGGTGSGNGGGGDVNDVILEALGNEVIAGGGGHDKITALSGINNIDGGAGNDFIMGGFKSDLLKGGIGNDILRGDASEVFGGSDTLEGGSGNDVLMGGAGADVFKFGTNDGNDIIGQFKTEKVNFDASTGYSVTVTAADFETSIDLIELNGFTTVNAANVMDFITDVGNNAVFNAEGTEITFFGILEDQLNSNDFLFV